jgi:hypothetical protein
LVAATDQSLIADAPNRDALLAAISCIYATDIGVRLGAANQEHHDKQSNKLHKPTLDPHPKGCARKYKEAGMAGLFMTHSAKKNGG